MSYYIAMTINSVSKPTFAQMALLSSYKVITVTHHNLNVNEIGHFFLRKQDNQDRGQSLSALKAQFDIEECLYLETCNRVAFVFYKPGNLSNQFLGKFFKVVNPQLEQKTLSNIDKFVSAMEGEQAIQHIFELASSMDSLVVGEREIFRQFREAYEAAKAQGHTGDNLRLLEKSTVENAKEIYHKTKIGEKPLSVVSLAMQTLLQNNVSRSSRILLVGAGETNALVAKFLKKYAFTNIKIYNRSLHNAAELSEELGGATACHIHELKEIKGQFDIIFICTSASKVIIDQALYNQMLSGDDSEKTIIDLAVPRNVSAEVVANNTVRHIDIEGLKKLSEENLEFRKQELEKARPIIYKNLSKFKQLFQGRLIEKAMSAVPQEIAAVKSRALKEVYKDRVEALDDESKSLVLEMMDYMEKKCISVPMKLAKKEL